MTIPAIKQQGGRRSGPLPDHVFPALNPYTRIRQNEAGYYLSSQLHRVKVQLSPQQAGALTSFDGRQSLGKILEFFDPPSRPNLTAFLLNLQSYRYVDCFDRPNPAGPVILPENPSPRLQEVHLDITSRCNLQCRHCYQDPYLGENLKGKELETNEWRLLLDQLQDLNVDRVNISGGEPLLLKDLLEIITSIFSRGLKLSSIFTNGILPLEPLLDYFQQQPYPVDFSVSLDGPTPASHEAIRGKNTFAATMNTIDTLVKHVQNDPLKRYSFDINTCVFNTNLFLLGDMYRFIKQKGVPRWRISLPRDEGSFIRNSGKLQAPLPGVFDVYRRLIHSYLEDFERLGVDQVPYLQVESIFRTSMLTGKEVVIFTPRSSCCEYKRYGLAVKPNGDVLSCTSFHSLKLSNIRRQNLREIWYNEDNQYLKRLPIQDIHECAGCELLKYCGTGCRSNALDRVGSITAKDELACRIYEFFAREILPIIQRRGVKCIDA
jgi:radical SAM protein with 4Fe4S-binding SPASM domain